MLKIRQFLIEARLLIFLKYLNSTKNFKITYTGTGEFTAFTDSNLERRFKR